MQAAAYSGARMVFKLSCIAPFVKLYRKSKATEQLQSRCMLAKIWDILTLKIQRCNKVFFFSFSFRNFAGSIKMLLPSHFMKAKKNFGKCQS